jgi:hypothetical protein
MSYATDSLKLLQYEELVNLLNNQDLIINSIKKNTILFNALRNNNETKYILHFSEGECLSCLKEVISDLLTITDLIGIENIIVTGSFKNDNDFFEYVNKLNSDLNFIPFNDFTMACGLKEPILILMNGLTIRSIYLPGLINNEDRYDFFFKTLPSLQRINQH